MKLSLYQRYLFREVLLATLLVLAAFLSLFGFFDLVAELKDVGQNGYALQHAALYVLLKLPGRAYELMPIAMLIGTLFALSTLARHSEITVLRASGVSTGRLLRSLFIAALPFALLTFFIGEAVAPPAERMASELRVRVTSGLVGGDFRTGLWVKDDLTFVNIKAVTPDVRLQGVRLYEFNKKYELLAVSDASEGYFVPDQGWRLREVVRTRVEGSSGRVEKEPEMLWSSALTPDILSVLLVVPERMSILNLATYIKHLSVNKQKTERYEIALWKKLVYPLATLVMVALALPFGYTHDRVGGVSLKIFGGIMLGIFFHMLNGLFSSLGIIHNWPPLGSAIAPSALFMLAAVLLIAWVERR